MGISLQNITYYYNNTLAVDSISAEIKKGEFVSLIGPNGGGKTTLLKLIIGLLHPSKGQILIDGHPPEEARSNIGYVPQHANFDLRFPITVKDVILSGLLQPRKLRWKNTANESLRQVLEMVDLPHVQERHFSELSGGQRQRVLIARALISDPDYLMLDEPTSNVDAVISEQLHSLLKQLHEDKTIILVTHDFNMVSSLSRRVLCIRQHLHEHPVESIHNKPQSNFYADRLKVVRHDINLLDSHECDCEEHYRALRQANTAEEQAANAQKMPNSTTQEKSKKKEYSHE